MSTVTLDQPTPDHILQVGLGFWASKILLSAVEMGLFTELAHGPADLETVRGRLGLHSRAARDFLDALLALGFLGRHDGHYYNTPAVDLFLDKRKPSYLGGILEMANHRLYGHWSHLTEGLRTGQPQNEVRGGGQPLFETLYADPARLKGLTPPAHAPVGFKGVISARCLPPCQPLRSPQSDQDPVRAAHRVRFWKRQARHAPQRLFRRSVPADIKMLIRWIRPDNQKITARLNSAMPRAGRENGDVTRPDFDFAPILAT